MSERDPQSTDELLDSLQRALEINKMNNRIEVMWDPSLADPEIHLEDPDLDGFLQTFADDERGKRIQTWVEGGSKCESQLEGSCRGQQRAVGSVDFHGGTIDDSVLACRQDLRPVYADIMNNAVRAGGLSYDVRINGKEIPKPSSEPGK